VFEAAPLVGGSVIGPVGAGFGVGLGEGDPAPDRLGFLVLAAPGGADIGQVGQVGVAVEAAAGQLAVGQAQVGRFAGAGAGVVDAAEVGDHRLGALAEGGDGG
jgi:hypothetical protein